MANSIEQNLQADPGICERAETAFNRAMATWSIAPPQVRPLVLDFGLGDFDRVGLVESWVCNEFEAGYCGKFMFNHAGQSAPMHWHHKKHETFFVVRGQVEVAYAGATHTLSEGQTLAIEPRKQHGFTAVGGASLILELSMPCDVLDNHFEDERINAWLRRATASPVAAKG